MNLNYLAAFDAVARTRSVTLGAERLGVSQPAVSKQIGMLERSLGTKLFDRHPRGVTLTPAGRALAELAGRAFDLIEQAGRAVSDLSSLRRGSLAVGATPTLGAYLLPDALVRFRERFPGIEVRAEIASAATLSGRIRDGALDVVLSDVLLDGDDAVTRVLDHERLVAVSAAANPLARQKSVTLAALAGEPFVVRDTGSAARSFAERELARLGMTIRPTLSLATTEAVKRAVVVGIGVALLPALAVTAELAAGTLRVLPVRGLDLRRPIYLTRPGGRTEAKPAIALRCLLKHVARGSLPPRRGQPSR